MVLREIILLVREKIPTIREKIKIFNKTKKAIKGRWETLLALRNIENTGTQRVNTDTKGEKTGPKRQNNALRE